MKDKIKQTLSTMKVKLDREDAETKALDLYKMGPEALDAIVSLGWKIHKSEQDRQNKTDILRAVILTISVFLTKDRSYFFRSDKQNEAVSLLVELSIHGFNSAHTALNTIGFSGSEIQQKKLLSLPKVEKHVNDQEISINEAVEEIRLSKFLSGAKGFSQNHYDLGNDEKREYKIYRIGKNLFARRSRRR